MTVPDNNRPGFLEQPESRRLEFKERFPKGEKIARSAIAFANGAGGRIVFGVQDDPRKIVGIPDDQIFPLEERITYCIFDLCEPLIAPEIYIQSVDDKVLLVVDIFPGPEKPYYLKKSGKQAGTYIRVGSSNRKASGETIDALENRRRRISFDSLLVYDLILEDSDLSGFKKSYEEHTGKKLGETQLKNMGLIRREHDRQYPTHAGLLLSDSPDRKVLFPFAKIECARFKGTDKRVFLDQATIEGAIHTLAEPAIAFIQKNTALSSTIGEIYRKDRWEYPMDAVREALINAIIHRDYALKGSDVKLAIYDDMLEITSPGPLPDALPIEELGTGRSEIRNRVLAPVFKDLMLIEAWGSGIQKMKQDIEDYPAIELILKEVAHAFQVQFVKKDLEGAESRRSRGRVEVDSQPESAPRRDQVGTKKGLSRDQVGTKQEPSKHQVSTEKRAEPGQSQGQGKAEPQPESRQESQPESLAEKVLRILSESPFSKAELSQKLGQKEISGQLNKVIQSMRRSGLIEYTIPEKPNSRLQKYRLKNQE